MILLSVCISAGGVFSVSEKTAEALTQAEQEAQWRAELQQTEQDIAKWQAILDNTKQGTASLQKEAAVLNAKIQEAKAFIRQRNIQIEQLGRDIDQKTANIKTLEGRIDAGHDSLAQLLRKTNEIDSYTLPEVVLANQNLSDFFSDLDTFQTIKRSMQNLFLEIRTTKDLTMKEREALDQKKNQELDTRMAAEAQKRQVEKNEQEKQYLIKVNKTQEKTYEQVLSERKARAAQIRAALFALRDTASIPFGDALKYAQEASAKTGVRPAFILAILTQESNLGQNVGSCLLTNTETGEGKGANTGSVQKRVMSPTRDVPLFLDITAKLGRDPYNTRVSCWQPIYDSKGAPIGWGGAMGPSQFIPSTWNGFISRIAAATGSTNPDPWNPRDAFFASAMYLSDLGAGAGTYSAEKTAACKYYAGAAACKTSYANSYGTSVMNKAANIQENMIDPLANI